VDPALGAGVVVRGKKRMCSGAWGVWMGAGIGNARRGSERGGRIARLSCLRLRLWFGVLSSGMNGGCRPANNRIIHNIRSAHSV